MTSGVNFAQPDVTLRLDLSGIIRRAVVSNAISNEGIGEWLGQPWADTVARADNANVHRMIDDARTTGVSPFHQLRQRFPSGLELSVEYTTVRLGGDESGLLAIGRNLEAISELRSRLLAAQRSMERDYWKLRDVETRYRLLFDASSQPVLLIGADNLRIMEANPAAIRALGVAGDCELLPEILPGQRDAFHAMLGRVREQGKAPGIVMHLGQDRQPWLMRASLVASEPAAFFVLQLSPSGTAPLMVDRAATARVRLEDVIARLPDGFVVMDADGAILSANKAFLELVEVDSESSVLGERLGRWLAEPGADAEALLGKLKVLPAIRQFAASMQGERGTQTPIEISATGNVGSSALPIGVVLRRLTPTAAAQPAPMSTAEVLGRLTLREIVQETVTSVERRCIETALEVAKGNRTVAAQMLGLSRQSLYQKLNRYSVDPEPPLPK